MRRGTRVLGLVGELKRRKVWQVAVTYVSVGIAVALAFAELYDDAGLPEWTTKFVLVLLLLGLPIALVLAWAYELRPEEGAGGEQMDLVVERSGAAVRGR